MSAAPADRPSLHPDWRSPLLGTKLPDLAHALSRLQLLPGDDAKEGTIANGIKTRVLLVEFWATWCEFETGQILRESPGLTRWDGLYAGPPCREIFPHLSEIRAKYKPDELTVIGVNNEHIRVSRARFLFRSCASRAQV